MQIIPCTIIHGTMLFVHKNYEFSMDTHQTETLPTVLENGRSKIVPNSKLMKMAYQIVVQSVFK